MYRKIEMSYAISNYVKGLSWENFDGFGGKSIEWFFSCLSVN